MNSGKPPLPALTGVRFFLAFWVVLYHEFPFENSLEIPWLPHLPSAAYCVLRTGYIAVTVFFLLSGFVLSYNYDLRARWTKTAILNFAAARFARIYPAYLLGFLLVLPFAVYRVFQGLSTFGAEAFSGLLNVALLQAWVPSLALSWNFPGWSLSNEAFFYAAFPVVGVLVWKLSRTPRRLLAVASAVWILSLLVPVWSVLKPVPGFGDVPAAGALLRPEAGFWPNLICYGPLLRLPEFVVGVLLGRSFQFARESSSRMLGKGYLLYFPAGVLALVALSYADVIPQPLIHNSLLLPLYACILLGLAFDGGPIARALSTRPVVFLGNASYSLYILHAPLASWLRILFRRTLHLNAEGGFFVAVYALTAVVLSAIAYSLYEEPASRFFKAKLRPALARKAAAA